MSDYTMRSIMSVVDADEAEKELNNLIKTESIGIHPEDIQIFAEVNKYSYYPIKFSIDKDKNIKIDNSILYADVTLGLGSKRQFLYKRYIVESSGHRLELDQYFRTAWDESKFMIFRNGRLVNPNMIKMVIPQLTNDYARKCIYTFMEIYKDDIIDVFYIECDDYITNNVPITRDVHLNSLKYTARFDNETIIKIPYPNLTYTRSEHSFFVFNDKGQYLDNRYDYDTSEDGKYITLLEHNKLLKNGQNYLMFTFPYVQAELETQFPDTESDAERSSIEFFRCTSIRPNPYIDGTVEFEPRFEDSALTKKSFMIFGGTTWIHPDRYDFVNNYTIKFKNTAPFDPVTKQSIDIERSKQGRYTMFIFNETNKFNERYGQVEYLVKEVVAEEHNQSVFDIPVVDKKYLSFLLFCGSILYDRDGVYELDATNHRITFLHPEDYVSKGRHLYFVFLKPSRGRVSKETIFRKMQFPINKTNPTVIPPYMYEGIQFDDRYLLLFFRGVYIEPTRYTIEKNKIYMKTNPVDGGYLPEELPPGNITAVYLAAYTDPDSVNPFPDIVADMKEDNDYVQFEERYNDTYFDDDNNLLIQIPFPYEVFKDTSFFLTTEDGLHFIPQRLYKRIDSDHLKFINDEELSYLSSYDTIRFTFLHNANKRFIDKREMVIDTISNIDEYQLPMTPYNEFMNLNMRYKIFYDGKGLSKSQVSIDSRNGLLYLYDIEIEGDKKIDILCFFTGVRKNKAIQTLPESGYLYLKRHDIDRNYNQNLMAVFINGKLIDRKDITKMTNNVYKINKDIKTRYNVEVRNMSPKIDSIVPFYKRANIMEEEPKQIIFRDFSGTVHVPNLIPHNRKYIEYIMNPIIFDPDILQHPEWYISLIHRSNSHNKDNPVNDIAYILQFFRDDYYDYPESIDVTLEFRITSNRDDLTPQSESSVLLVKLPLTITQIDEDYCYSTMSIRNLFDFDHHNKERAIDGILGRLNISGIRTKENHPSRLYYELTANKFEDGDRVGIFEWVVSTERDGKGITIWKQHVDLQPSNSDQIKSEYDDEEDEDDG